MALQSYSLNFYLNLQKKSVKNGYPIYARIIVNRKKAEFSTKNFVKDLKKWDLENQMPTRKGSYLHDVLSLIRTDLNQVKANMDFRREVYTAKDLKTMYLSKDKSTMSLKKFLEVYLTNQVEANPEYSEGTKKNYRATCTHLKNFQIHTELETVLLTRVDLAFVKRLDGYLIGVEGHRRNTANKYHSKFKHILEGAIKENYLGRNPYSDFKLKDEDSLITYLTQEELDALIRHKLGGNATLEKVRDIFLFSLYTGIRFTSATNLKEENIEVENGQHWIHFYDQKPKKYRRIPMLKKAIEVYKKYADLRASTGYLLPRITNQKENLYLKVIADIVGINKKLTSNVARHTFATTILLANGTPLEVVSKYMGHSKLATTQVYGKIHSQILARAASEIDAKLK